MASDGNTPSPPTPAAPTTTYVTVPSLRDPGTFSAQNGVDVDDWLSMYERVSRSHHWDPTIMLANVIYYLDGTPLVWFRTHEVELSSWDTFKERLRDLFGNPSGRQQAARKELATRVQSSTESYVAYIQEVLALCRKVDEHMTEVDKVGHILKGIADDAFNLLVYNDVSTVDAIVKECRRFEVAKSRRVVPQFSRLPNTPATSSCSALPATRPFQENVTRIVRREIEAASPAPLHPRPLDGTFDPAAPTISVIQAVVRQEIANLGIPTACSVSRPDSASIPMATSFNDQYFAPRPRNPAEWRTPDDKPICFRCHRVGHVSRHCRSTWMPPYWSSFPAPRPYADARRYSPRRPYSTSDAPDSRSSGRSPSPQRRRSPSPQPRRFSSPNRRTEN